MFKAKAILTFAILGGLLLAATAPVLAVGESEFLFFGYARYAAGDPPDAVGSRLEAYGRLATSGGVPLPIPLATAVNEYTVCLSDLVVTSASVTPTIISLTIGSGDLRIYADPLAGGTPSDFAAPGTFTDGDLILQASVDPGWTAALYDFDGNGFFTLGANGGTCSFVGGSQLQDLIDAEFFLDGWGLFGSPYVDPNPPLGSVPDGYHRIFNAKIVAPNDPTPSSRSTWGGVKGLFR